MRTWKEIDFLTSSRPPGDPAALVRRALEESLERHLVSDVPVGLFLSGGIDSTALLALLRAVRGKGADLRTFSIAFDDPDYDEGEIARRTAGHFGAQHSEWKMTASEGAAEVGPYLAAMDQPTIDGFNTWCVSKLAREHGVSVVLSGLGGDELFGGYSTFRRVPRLRRLHRTLGPLRCVAARMLGESATAGKWRRLAEFLGGSGGLPAAYRARRGIFTEQEARQLCGELNDRDPGIETEPESVRTYLPRGEADAVSYLEITRYMRNQLLRDSDIFSMAHGLELRVPFVDGRLFEVLRSIPADVRLRPEKRLLLDAVPEIPEWVRNRPKQGFRFPFAEWASSSFGTALREGEREVSVALREWYRKWAIVVADHAVKRVRSSRSGMSSS